MLAVIQEAYIDDSVPSSGVDSPRHAATTEVGYGLVDGLATLTRPQGPQPCCYTVFGTVAGTWIGVVKGCAIDSSLM